MTKLVTCEECHQQVKMTIKCIRGCDMWLCARCTLASPKHDSGRGDHWEMLVARMSSEEQANIKRLDEISRGLGI